MIRIKIITILLPLVGFVFADCRRAEAPPLGDQQALYEAAKTGDLETFAALILKGTNPSAQNVQGFEAGDTALIISSRAGNGRIFDFLLSNIKVIPDLEKQKALVAASSKNRWHIVEKLLKQRVNPNTYDLLHKPIMAAARGGHLETVEMLYQKGARIDFRDMTAGAFGRTALMFAAEGRHAPVISYLITKGANVNLRTLPEDNPRVPEGGATALMLTFQESTDEYEIDKHRDAVQTLLNAGADLALKDNMGLSALDWAHKSKRSCCNDILSRNNSKDRPEHK